MDLVAIAATASSLTGFVEGGALEGALAAIGGKELEAARRVFSSLDASKDPKHAVNRALVHLESAHLLFFELWNKRTNFGRIDVSGDAEKRDFWTCCLAAICHRFLGDDGSIINAWLDSAANAGYYTFAKVTKQPNLVDWIGAGVSFLNPVFYYRCFKDKPLPECPSEAQFKEFRRLLTKK